MSWLDRRSFACAAAVVAMSLSLSACFRPLYGPTASGERVDATLAAIEVAEMDVIPAYERMSHYLRSEVVYALNGSGLPTPKRYKLALGFSQTIESPIVDTVTGRASSATVIGDVSYTLTTLDGSKVLSSGTATSYASYDRYSQRFTTVRAARDADIRLAKALADQIKTRLAVALATSG